VAEEKNGKCLLGAGDDNKDIQQILLHKGKKIKKTLDATSLETI
jgi:hypothetical protein